MNTNIRQVKFRTKDNLHTARLVFERQKAFAVLDESGQKGSADIAGEERIELDARFLEKIDSDTGESWFYKKEVHLPEPGRP